MPSKEVLIKDATSKDVFNKDPPVSPSMPELKSPPSIAQLKSMMQVMGSKRRKRSRNGGNSIEEMTQDGPKQTKVIVVYMVFFAESSLPGTHRCEVILRAILKRRTWVTAGD